MSKIKRNDPCPCGSGKKYKKCCLNKKVSSVTPAAAVKEANTNAKLMAQKWMSALGGDATTSAGEEYRLYLDEFRVSDPNVVERIRSMGKPSENGVLFYEGKQWVAEAVFSEDGVMTLTTADLKVANKLTGKLERLSGVSHQSRKSDVLETGELQDPAALGKEMLSFKVNFFKAWPDEANERLDGATPREAASDPKLRPALLQLLKELEKAEARRPKKDRYSFKGVRKELGL